MTVYDRSGICFPYPENWVVREEELQEWPRSVVAESPSGAFWSLHVYPEERDCRTLAAEVAGVMRTEYDSLESLPPTDTAMLEEIVDSEVAGEDMTFYCLDFLVAARVRCFRAQGKTYVTLSQAEDREFESLNQVFLAMTIGMLRSLEGKT